jgi:flavin-dependent thymidylate synthase
MRVKLLSCTPDALDVLLFTRSTRLNMSLDAGMQEIRGWSQERKLEELEKARNTIQSSWEFIDYIFCIEGVTRAFTHQLVRHRVGTSFAQQAQRVVDMSDFSYEVGPSIREDAAAEGVYVDAMREIARSYHKLVHDHDIPPQDARGVLPTNIHTNIIFKANLRTLHDMGLKRLCVKAQGEFQDVFRALRDAVAEVHPWAQDFIRVQCAWNGICAFPTYPTADCPVKSGVYNPLTRRAYGGAPGSFSLYSLEDIEDIWARERAEAQPKA